MADDHNQDGWTFDTLEKYLDGRITAVEKNVTTAMVAADKAGLKAETATEKRFDSVNEFREAMKDQQSTFADRGQTELRLKAIERGMDKIGCVSLGVTICAAVGAGFVSAIASVVLIEVALRHG